MNDNTKKARELLEEELGCAFDHLMANDLVVARPAVRVIEKLLYALSEKDQQANSACEVYVDFPSNIGTCGPFRIYEGRLAIPEQTVRDLVQRVASSAGGQEPVAYKFQDRTTDGEAAQPVMPVDDHAVSAALASQPQVSIDLVRELEAEVATLRQRAIRAHQICNLARVTYPQIGELDDDGCLHEAIHDILRVPMSVPRLRNFWQLYQEPGEAAQPAALASQIAGAPDPSYFYCMSCKGSGEPRAPAAVPVDAELKVIESLLSLAYAAWNLADNTEDAGDDGLSILRADFDQLCDRLVELDELPDDQPDYTMEAAAKARWALRRLLTAAPQPAAPQGVDLGKFRDLIGFAVYQAIQLPETDPRRDFIRQASEFSALIDSQHHQQKESGKVVSHE